MINIFSKYTASLLLATCSSLAVAGSGFLQDSDGNVVNDGFGECVSINNIKHAHGPEGEHTHCGQTPEKKVEKPAPAPAKREVLQNVSLGAHALFDTNKSDLRAAGKAELDALVDGLGKVKRVDQITITGHTDSRGSEKYNQGLSERRANSVRDYLVSRGVSSSSISTNGRGELEPVASNDTTEGRQKNRRVDIVIEGVK